MKKKTKYSTAHCPSCICGVYLIIALLLVLGSLSACKTVKRDTSTDAEVHTSSDNSSSNYKHDVDSLSKVLWQRLIENWTSELGAKIHITKTEYDTTQTDSAGQHPIQSTTQADVDLTARQEHNTNHEKEETSMQTHQSDSFGETESHVSNDSTSHEHTKESVNHTTFQQKIGFTIMICFCACMAWFILVRKR